MKKYTPSYYDRFSCLAGECPDTCCAAWEITAEDELIKKLEALGTDFSAEVLGKMKINDDGEHIFALENGRCPFLNADNLCDIHIKIGEEYTCGVCRQHPRFIEEYDGFTEIALSLSCPAAADIIFGEKLTESTYPCPEAETDDILLEKLIIFRDRLIRSAAESGSISAAFGEVLEMSDILQDIYDYFGFEDMPEAQNDGSCDLTDFIPEDFSDAYIAFLLKRTEILTDRWKEMLEKASAVRFDKEKSTAFLKENGADMLKVFAYYLYRYYLKAVNDENIILHALFVVISVTVCAEISLRTGESFRETARLYSKETEHDTVNIDLAEEYIESLLSDFSGEEIQ